MAVSKSLALIAPLLPAIASAATSSFTSTTFNGTGNGIVTVHVTESLDGPVTTVFGGGNGGGGGPHHVADGHPADMTVTEIDAPFTGGAPVGPHPTGSHQIDGLVTVTATPGKNTANNAGPVPTSLAQPSPIDPDTVRSSLNAVTSQVTTRSMDGIDEIMEHLKSDLDGSDGERKFFTFWSSLGFILTATNSAGSVNEAAVTSLLHYFDFATETPLSVPASITSALGLPTSVPSVAGTLTSVIDSIAKSAVPTSHGSHMGSHMPAASSMPNLASSLNSKLAHPTQKPESHKLPVPSLFPHHSPGYHSQMQSGIHGSYTIPTKSAMPTQDKPSWYPKMPSPTISSSPSTSSHSVPQYSAPPVYQPPQPNTVVTESKPVTYYSMPTTYQTKPQIYSAPPSVPLQYPPKVYSTFSKVYYPPQVPNYAPPKPASSPCSTAPVYTRPAPSVVPPVYTKPVPSVVPPLYTVPSVAPPVYTKPAPSVAPPVYTKPAPSVAPPVYHKPPVSVLPSVYPKPAPSVQPYPVPGPAAKPSSYPMAPAQPPTAGQPAYQIPDGQVQVPKSGSPAPATPAPAPPAPAPETPEAAQPPTKNAPGSPEASQPPVVQSTAVKQQVGWLFAVFLGFLLL